MLQGNAIVLAAGLLIAVALVALGVFLGLRIARRRYEKVDPGMSQADQGRMLRLLKELGSWTTEYSGNVARYQDELGELAEAVRDTGLLSDANLKNHDQQTDSRLILLLQQIMKSNSELKARLDVAERQLEKQTKQIESYLTEARTDGLTGLFNRRAFDQRIDELFASYRRGGRSFVLALVDIDHFKVINDTHGHQVGDQVLQLIAKALKVNLDSAIMVARFGGEEFAVITEGPLRVAAEKMNELRKTIAKMRLDVGPTQLQVTISIGLSEPRDDMVVNPVVRRADEALYTAKNIGRNRTYYHDGKGPSLVGAPEITRE